MQSLFPDAQTLAASAPLTIGIRTRDPDAAADFYATVFALDSQPAEATGRARRVTAGTGVSLELVAAPAGERPASIPTIAKPGLVNLTFYVAALDPLCEAVTAAGGTVLAETRTALGPDREGVFASDPDGTPIEIIATPTASGFGHVVACVPDLAGAAALFEAAGYAIVRSIAIAEPVAAVDRLTRLDGAILRGIILQHPAAAEIELIDVERPLVDHTSPTYHHDLGLSHLALDVGDAAAAAAAATRAGGRQLPPPLPRPGVVWHGIPITFNQTSSHVDYLVRTTY